MRVLQGLLIAGGVAAVVACTQLATPTRESSTTTAQYNEDGTATVQATPVPLPNGASPVPRGPVPVPRGPVPVPRSPVPVPRGPQPSTPPGSSPAPGPSPSPGATPSPGTSPSPSPTPCAPRTITFNSTSVPMTTSGGNFQGPVINIDGTPFAGCVVGAMRVRVSATAPDLAGLGATWVLRLDRPGAGPIGFDLIRLTGTALTGTQLGTVCGLVFDDTGGSFSSASPPYNGQFQPAGQSPDPPGFGDYLGAPVGGDYGLYPAFLATDSSMTITCYQLEFDLR